MQLHLYGKNHFSILMLYKPRWSDLMTVTKMQYVVHLPSRLLTYSVHFRRITQEERCSPVHNTHPLKCSPWLVQFREQTGRSDLKKLHIDIPWENKRADLLLISVSNQITLIFSLIRRGLTEQYGLWFQLWSCSSFTHFLPWGSNRE